MTASSAKGSAHRMSGPGSRADVGGPSVVLPRECIGQLKAHAKQAYPDECCGALIGRPGERRAVHSVHPTENQYSGSRRDRFEIDPREIVRLDRRAEGDGLDIVAFYHSHPDHPARPSATDEQYAWPAYVYLIVPVINGGPETVTAWLYDETRREFDECTLVVREAGTLTKEESTDHGGDG